MPRWLWVLGVLLIINIVVLLLFMFRSPTNAISREATSPPVAQKVVAAAQPLAPAPAAETVAATVAEQRSNSFQERLDAVQRDKPEEIRDPVKTLPEPVQEIAPAPANTRATLPDVTELRVNGTLNLPDLHLDMHYLHTSRERSFVFVNNDKYREGDTLKEGPQVIEIVSDGVVLEHRGRRFMLPR